MKKLSRDAVKYIAMLLMLLCHTVIVFELRGTVYNIIKASGYFTSVIMPYFIVEGYRYTRSVRAYFIRLVSFAFVSQMPFILAFGANGTLNMFFTLCICFAVVWVMDCVDNLLQKLLFIGLLILSALWCDWSYRAPLWTLAFIWGYGSKRKTAMAFAAVAGGMAILRFTKYSSVIDSIIYVWGMLLAGVCVVFCYNGKRATWGRIFSKWFFYIFYPLHLLILWGIKQIIL